MTDSVMQLDSKLPLSIEYTFYPIERGYKPYVEIRNISIGILSTQTSIYDILPLETFEALEERVLEIHLQENENV